MLCADADPALLSDYWCDDIDLFAPFLPGRSVPPRIRLFVDFIAGRWRREGRSFGVKRLKSLRPPKTGVEV